jgi:Lrp/AsnC family leucine-responsive transcriptional regulator
MDLKDTQIIRALQTDGRMTIQELSEQVALSPSPCLRRLRNLEAAGVIQGYTVLVDQKAYGLPVTAFVRIRMERHSGEAMAEFERRIARIDQVLDCHLMTGDADYLLRVVVESLEDYEQLVRREFHAIPGIASLETSFAYGVVKQSRVFPRRRPD